MSYKSSVTGRSTVSLYYTDPQQWHCISRIRNSGIRVFGVQTVPPAGATPVLTCHDTTLCVRVRRYIIGVLVIFTKKEIQNKN
jgi:hypothetical protein